MIGPLPPRRHRLSGDAHQSLAVVGDLRLQRELEQPEVELVIGRREQGGPSSAYIHP